MSTEESVSLREYLEARLEEVEKATKLASLIMDRRLEGMNEFREQLRNQASQFLTKETYDSRHELLQKQVDELKLNRAVLEGKASQTSVIGSALLAIAALLFSLFDMLLKLLK